MRNSAIAEVIHCVAVNKSGFTDKHTVADCGCFVFEMFKQCSAHSRAHFAEQ